MLETANAEITVRGSVHRTIFELVNDSTAEIERRAAIRNALRRLGVVRIELAYRAVKDEIVADQNGLLCERGLEHRDMNEFLADFVKANPHLREG